MIVRNCIDVFHAAVTHFNFISVEYLVKGVVFLGNGYLVSVKKIGLLSLWHFYSMVVIYCILSEETFLLLSASLIMIHIS